MSTCRARSNTNAGAGDAPAPSDDRRLGMSKNHGTANKSSSQGQSRSTPHVFLHNVDWNCFFKTAI
jgi:hypothetical protein